MDFVEAYKNGIIKKCDCKDREFIFEKFVYETIVSDRRKNSINNLLSMVLIPKTRINVRYKIKCAKCGIMWTACETKKRAKEIIKLITQ